MGTLTIKNISFKFDRHIDEYFFQDLSVTFELNKVHFIQGSNGIGKSTLFNILQGNTHHGMYLTGTCILDSTE